MFWKRSSLDEKRQYSFCYRGEDVAGELVGAPSNDSLDRLTSVYICGDCIAVCNGIFEDRADRKIKKIMASRGITTRSSFCE